MELGEIVELERIEYMELEKIIHNKIRDYICKYLETPNYIKMPIWVFECLNTAFRNMITNGNIRIDYGDGLIKYRGLIICPTKSIQHADEIEVF